MSAVVTASKPSTPLVNRWLMLWLAAIAITVLLMLAKEWLPWAFKYPRALQLPLAGWISDFMKWLINSFDLGLFTFKEFTRGIAWLVEQPYTLVKSMLSTGFLRGVGSDAVQVFPRISWIALIAEILDLPVAVGNFESPPQAPSNNPVVSVSRKNVRFINCFTFRSRRPTSPLEIRSYRALPIRVRYPIA